MGAHAEGRLEDAERLYRRLLKDRPRDHEAIHQIGIVRMQQGALEAAQGLLEDAAAMAPEVARYQTALGNVYQATGRDRAARAALERAVALDPTSATAWSGLGVLRRLAGQTAEAIEALREAARRRPDSAPIQQNLAAALEQGDDLAGARAALDRAAELDPRDPDTWCALGKLHDRQDEAAQAEAMYRRALLCDRGHAQSWANLAERLRRDGRLEEALTAAERALEADPRQGAAYVTFGLTLRDQGHLKPAIATWQRAVTAAPTPEAMLNLGEAYAELGMAAQAEGTLRELTARFPERAPGWASLGELLTLSAPEEAARCFRRALELDPDHPGARHLLSALEGAPAAVASPAYVRRLFDEYAGRFERHLTEDLSYQTPQQIAALLGDGASLGRVADLGCGTGLMGAAIRERCAHLVGVDLSPQMIARAREREIYDALHVGGIVETLPVLGEVDLAVAADVMNYFGELEWVLSAAAAVGVPRLVFSVEHLSDAVSAADGVGWRLQPSGRYAHRSDYVVRAAEGAGYVVAGQELVGLRRERGAWVSGTLFDLRRRSPPSGAHPPG